MLLKEFLEPLGVSQVEAATRMSIPFQRLNAIVNGRRAVSADPALLLDAADRLGRSDLANAAGEVGSVARDEIPPQPAEGPTAAKDRIGCPPIKPRPREPLPSPDCSHRRVFRAES